MESVNEVLLVSDSASKEFNCVMYDLPSGSLLETYREGHSIPRGLEFIGSDFVISAFKDKPFVKVWQIGNASNMCRRMTCPHIVTALAVSKDGLYCVAGMEKSTYIWEVATGSQIAHHQFHVQDITCIRFTSDDTHLITAGKDGMVFVFVFYQIVLTNHSFTEVLKPCYQWMDHTAEVTDVYVGYLGFYSRVATASKDMSCRIYELDTGNHLLTVNIDAPITAVTMDACENFMFLGTTVGDIYRVNLFSNVKPILHFEDVEKKNVYVGHRKEITCLCISQSGTYLISGSDKEFKVWNINSFTCYKTQPTAGIVTNVLTAFLPPSFKNKQYNPRIVVNDFQKCSLPDFFLETGVNINNEELSLFHAGASDRLFDARSLHWTNEEMEKCMAKGNLTVEDLSRINNEIYSFALVDIFEKTNMGVSSSSTSTSTSTAGVSKTDPE